MDQEHSKIDYVKWTGSQIRHLDRAYIKFPDEDKQEKLPEPD